MKTPTLVLFALVAAAAACQSQAPATQSATAVVAKIASAQAVAAEPSLPVFFAAADTLTAPMRELLRQNDLSKLWQGDTEYRRTNPVLEGFFGPDHYRFALVFNEVKRDEQHPDVYWVRGKCHYRKNIRPFTGSLTVRQISDLDVAFDFAYSEPADVDSLDADTVNARYNRARNLLRPYSMRARLQIEENDAENSGSFEGEAILNFYVNPQNRTNYVIAPFLDNKLPGRGSAVFLRGARRNRTTKEVKKFVISDDVFAAAPDVYKDFGIGDRGGEINPKYAKLGWNELWKNDEWWADSPKPSLNL